MQNRSQQQSLSQTLGEAITAAGHTPTSISGLTGIDASRIVAGDLNAGEVSTIDTSVGRHYLATLKGGPA